MRRPQEPEGVSSLVQDAPRVHRQMPTGQPGSRGAPGSAAAPPQALFPAGLGVTHEWDSSSAQGGLPRAHVAHGWAQVGTRGGVQRGRGQGGGAPALHSGGPVTEAQVPALAQQGQHRGRPTAPSVPQKGPGLPWRHECDLGPWTTQFGLFACDVTHVHLAWVGWYPPTSGDRLRHGLLATLCFPPGPQPSQRVGCLAEPSAACTRSWRAGSALRSPLPQPQQQPRPRPSSGSPLCPRGPAVLARTPGEQ